MFDRHSSKEITVNKAELLAKLGENREKHLQEFNEAMAGYKDAMVAALEGKLAAAKRGELVDHVINLQRPANHCDDYDRAIGLVTWSVGETFVLTVEEFGHFIQDQWSWKLQHTAMANIYNSR